MKSALSITLITCLVGLSLPVTAQQQTATAGPLARAATRAAARFSTAAQSQPGDSEWLGVRELEPGTEITVTVKGSQPGQRYFIAGDQSYLTVLNVADSGLPPSAMQVLVDTAVDHPLYFLLAKQGKTFPLDENVRLALDGIFIGDRKVAELDQIVVQMERDNVAEISRWQRRVGRAIGWGAVIGAGAGALTGLVTGSRVCGRRNCDNFPPIAFGLIFGIFGGGIGTGIGAVTGAIKGKTRDVIYRRP
jgi:hypothetical protein